MLQHLWWLSVCQMIVFHSLILVFKTRMNQKPVYLHRQVSAQFSVNTRLAVSHGIRGTRHTQSEIGRKSFFPKTLNQWNSLPADVRSAPSLGKFKMKLKTWVKQHFWTLRMLCQPCICYSIMKVLYLIIEGNKSIYLSIYLEWWMVG